MDVYVKIFLRMAFILEYWVDCRKSGGAWAGQGR